MFKKLALAAVSAAALSAGSAYAAPTITFLNTVGGSNFDQFIVTGLTPGAAFNVSSIFGNTQGFTLVAADFTTTILSGQNDSNIDVTAASLNTVSFAGNFLSGDLATETGSVGPLTALNPNTLSFTGVAGMGDENTIAGNLRWAAPAVPEPATWLMMMAGFGAMGFALRRQKAATRRVNFNFA